VGTDQTDQKDARDNRSFPEEAFDWVLADLNPAQEALEVREMLEVLGSWGCSGLIS